MSKKDAGLPTADDVRGILPRDRAQWCPGCSQNVSEPCHHYHCPAKEKFASAQDVCPKCYGVPEPANVDWEHQCDACDGTGLRTPAACATDWEVLYNAETRVSAKQAAEIVQLRSQVERLTTALEFYADRRRYQGANQRPIPGDKFQPEGVVYRWCIERDGGDIAKLALSHPSTVSASEAGAK